MNARIRIAFVIDQIEAPTAGTEKQLCTIIEHLDRTRFAPCLCLLKESPWSRSEFCGELHIAALNSYFRPGTVRQVWRFASFLRREQFRIVHTFHRDGEIVGTLAARLAGVPCIVGSRRDQGYWLNRRERTIRAALRRLKHGYVTNAHSTRDWLVREESVPANRIEVIPNGVELAKFAVMGDRDTVRAEIGLTSDDLAAVCVATLRPIKRHSDVLAGLAAALKVDRRWKLILIGDGDCREALIRQASELGVSDRVRFLGTRQDIPRLLSGMDAGVLLSASESMSNTLLEYLAAGLPVVSSDVGDARYLIDDGANGYVIPVGDIGSLAAALGALSATQVRLRMGAVSRERSLGYDADSCTRRFEEYYERCLR